MLLLPPGIGSGQKRTGLAETELGSLSLGQTGQSSLIEAVKPILHRTRRVAQQSSHLRTRHALRDQQDTVQPVIVARLLRPLNLLLQNQNGSGVRYHEWSHDSRRDHVPASVVRLK